MRLMWLRMGAVVAGLVGAACAQAQVAAPAGSGGGASAQKPAAPASGPTAQTGAEMAGRAARPALDVVGTGATVDLKPKWKKGDEARYDFEFVNRFSVHMEGDETKKTGQFYKQEGRLVRRVLAVDESGVTLSLMIERLEMQVATAGQMIRYNSDWGDDPSRQSDLTGPVKACVGRPLTVRLSPEGEVVSVEGNEDPPVDPNNPEESVKKQVPQAVLGTAVVKKLWKPLYRLDRKTFDGHVGDKWTTDDYSTDPAMGTFDMALHQEIKDVKEGVATIAGSADVRLSPAIGPSAVPATLESSSVTGTTEWDAARGQLKSWSTVQELHLSAERGGVTQKAKTELKTSFRRVEK